MFKGNIGLCKWLGFGVMLVDIEDGKVQVYYELCFFVLWKNKQKMVRFRFEFDCCEGDLNLGGMKVGGCVMVYWQGVEKCCDFLIVNGLSKGCDVVVVIGVVNVIMLMCDNYYGWFEWVVIGVYVVKFQLKGVIDQFWFFSSFRMLFLLGKCVVLNIIMILLVVLVVVLMIGIYCLL